MGVFTITSRITDRKDVTESHIVARCKNHGQKPSVKDLYTGKRKKFQGTIVECPCSDDCTVFGYDAEDAVKKWNTLNFLNP